MEVRKKLALAGVVGVVIGAVVIAVNWGTGSCGDVDDDAGSLPVENPWSSESNCKDIKCEYLGIRHGDFDGDCQKDRAEIAFIQRATDGQYYVRVNLDLATGSRLSKQITAHYEPMAPRWLGAYDSNGDGRDEMFFTSAVGVRGLHVWNLELIGDEIRPLGGIDEDAWYLYGSGSGVTCRELDGRRQLVFVLLHESEHGPLSLTLEARETIFEADPTGQFYEVSSRELVYGRKTPDDPWPSEAESYFAEYGAMNGSPVNCPGLEVM